VGDGLETYGAKPPPMTLSTPSRLLQRTHGNSVLMGCMIVDGLGRYDEQGKQLFAQNLGLTSQQLVHRCFDQIKHVIFIQHDQDLRPYRPAEPEPEAASTAVAISDDAELQSL
jgi:hypothetical protein